MNFRKAPLFCLITSGILFASHSACADPSSETSKKAGLSLEDKVQQISAQARALQKEVRLLKLQLRQVQKQHKLAVQKTTVAPAAEKSKVATKNKNLIDIPYLNASPITNATLVDHDDDLDSSAFLSGVGSMSQGLFYLQQNKALSDKLTGYPLPSDARPQIMLGGKLEAQASWQNPYQGSNGTSIDLVTAELDVLAKVSPWAMGVMVVDYNNDSLNQVLLGSGDPVNNSNLFLDRGYITLGNLNHSPIYFNIGQMYVPFGRYSSNMLTNPTTQVLGRTNARAAELGFFKSGFNASLYAFDGASNTGNSDVNSWGANVSYQFSVDAYDVALSAGFINNLADSQGAQLTGADLGTFQGFSVNSQTESLLRYVPGVDAVAAIDKGPWYLVGEVIAATRAYAPQDMMFNGQGAEPKAAHLEIGKGFQLLGKKSIFSLAYDHTWEALAMGLARSSYTATFNISLLKNTVETLEFRHDVNYAATDTSSGACQDASGMLTVCPGPAGSGTQNTLLAQVGVYF